MKFAKYIYGVEKMSKDSMYPYLIWICRLSFWKHYHHLQNDTPVNMYEVMRSCGLYSCQECCFENGVNGRSKKKACANLDKLGFIHDVEFEEYVQGIS